MSPLAPILFVAALQFDAQDLGDIYIGAIDPLTGVPSVNFVQTDLDCDGEQDLLLQSVVYFQRAGKFPDDARLPLPDLPPNAALDVANGELFALGVTLRVFRWEAGGWTTVLDQPFPAAEPHSAESAVSLQRYLHDFEGDGIPEIIVPFPGGVQVFAQKEQQYTLAAAFDILPPLDLAAATAPVLWPPQERRLELPVRQMSCRLLLEGNRLTVLQRCPQPGNTQVFSRTDHIVEPGGGYHLRPGAPTTPSAPLKLFMRACRLNDDDLIDFAGGDWLPSASSAFPVPVYETWVTVNGGEDFKIIRVPSFQRFRPHCTFLDIDGDGDKDLIAESTGLFRSGPREMAVQLMTRRKIDHIVDVYTQEGGGFGPRPAFERRFEIDLEMVPLRNGPMFQRYQMGELVDLTGDFDGDALRDVLVRDHLESAQIHLSASPGYADNTQPPLEVPRASDVRVYDLNSDGRSDVILQPRQVAADPSPRAHVLFSRRGEP